MARRRKARTFGSFARKTYRSMSKKSLPPEKMLLPAIAYGAVRQDLSALAARVPFVGGFGDEAVLGVAGYIMAKKGSGMIRDIGLAALAVEAASIGGQLRSGTLFSGGMLTATTTNGQSATF